MGDDKIAVDGVDQSNREQFGENDVFFECPRCSKSMAIAKEGVGMTVECTDCGLELIVPPPDAEPQYASGAEDPEPETEEDNAPREEALEESYHLVREQRDLLFDEIAAIQSSLDRLVATLDSLND